MKGKDIDCLKEYLSKGKSLKVCILDNNSIEFLTRIYDRIGPEKIFCQYDIIFIPKWVWVEVCDSEKRKNYIYNLKHFSKVQIIDEVDYAALVDYKEAALYYIFLYSCNNVSRLVGFIKRNILQGRPVEDLAPYEEWLDIIYNEGLDKRELANGRIQRKNAGEISICVLSYIFSYFYSENIDTITIFSSDRDAYDFISKAKEKIYKEDYFRDKRYTSITFKSNDFLIYEWTRLGYIKRDNIDSFVNSYRQARRIKFTRKKQDNSIEEQERVIDNIAFLEMLEDDTLHLIF